MANKVSSMFVGTKDKCLGCDKTVYPTEKVKLQFKSYKFKTIILYCIKN